MLNPNINEQTTGIFRLLINILLPNFVNITFLNTV